MTTSAAKLLSRVYFSFGFPGETVTYTGTDVSRTKKQKKVRTGSWNVRTIYQARKIHNAIEEMDRMNIIILSISKRRWLDSGNINIEDHKVLYSRSTTGIHEHGVGTILTDKIERINMWGL